MLQTLLFSDVFLEIPFKYTFNSLCVNCKTDVILVRSYITSLRGTMTFMFPFKQSLSVEPVKVRSHMTSLRGTIKDLCRQWRLVCLLKRGKLFWSLVLLLLLYYNYYNSYSYSYYSYNTYYYYYSYSTTTPTTTTTTTTTWGCVWCVWAWVCVGVGVGRWVGGGVCIGMCVWRICGGGRGGCGCV